MKKLVLILALALVISMFPACAGGGTDSGASPENTGDNAPSGEDAAEPEAPEEAEQEPMTLQWNFTPPPVSIDAQINEIIAEKISDNTNGVISVELFGGGALGNEKVTLEGLTTGTLTMGSVSPNAVATMCPETNCLCLPFAFDSEEHFWKVITSEEYIEKMNEAVSDVGLHYLGVSYACNRNISLNDEVRTPSEASGQIIRVMDGTIYTDMLALWGFGSAVISYGEVYTAVQQGTADGIENSNDGNASMAFGEVVDYTIELNHVFHGQMIFMNKAAWDALTPSTQEAITQAFAEVMAEGYAKSSERNTAARQIMIDDFGVTMITPTEEELAEWKAAVEPLYEQYKSIIGEEFYNWFMEYCASMA